MVTKKWMANSWKTKMKYFTKKWCFGDLTEKAIQDRVDAYKTYIDKIYDELPFVLKVLSKEINLHDGIIKKITLNKDSSILNMIGIFGDAQVGYFVLNIKYVNVSNLNEKNLGSTVNTKNLLILSDEIEKIEGNLYSHRMIFSSKRELEINFEKIEIKIQNANQKQYKMKTCKLIIQKK